MLDHTNFHGIHVIVVTPFTPDLELDEAALRDLIRFNLTAGVHGLVTTAIASEGSYLSEAERRRVAEIVVEEAQGRVPVTVAVSAPHAKVALGYARHAEAIGADAVMALPPGLHVPSPAEIRDYYRAINEGCGLPLVLQNAFGPGAVAMGAPFLADLVNDLPNAPFIKEETAYAAQVTGEVIRLAGPRLVGVMGGRAGKTLMEEVRHGMAGTMPACEIADIHVAWWDAIAAGDQARARTIFRAVLPLLDFEGTYGVPVMKEILRRRGIIPHAAWRQAGCRGLDDRAQDELSELLSAVAPYAHADFPLAPLGN